jgi:hypothetical protein
MNALYRGLIVSGGLAAVAFYPITYHDDGRGRHDRRRTGFIAQPLLRYVDRPWL